MSSRPFLVFWLFLSGSASAPLIERNPLLFWKALCLILMLGILLLLFLQFGGRH
jgi:hypothetical protein